jgi:hypothetical protein
VGVFKRSSFDPAWPDIAAHFKYLIKEPLIHFSSPASLAVVFDALDECGSNVSQAGQRRIFIDTLAQWSSLSQQYKLIVTRRNDRVPETFRAVCRRITLSTGPEADKDANADIRHFFKMRFADFRDCLGPELQGGSVLDQLTTRAAGLFIWADTVVRFMEQGVHEMRLQRVLSGDISGGDITTDLYRQILDLSFGKTDDYTLKIFIQIISVIILAKVPLHEDDLPQFILQLRTQINSILNKLSSVISTGMDGQLRISHLTFSEYLCESDRCPGQFRVGRKEKHTFAMACFRVMRDEL